MNLTNRGREATETFIMPLQSARVAAVFGSKTNLEANFVHCIVGM
jgi:hypothetical protein